MEKNIQGHRLQVKWPKSNSKKEWAKIDADLIKVLNGIKGSVEKKLEKMGDLIYSYGAERFGANEMGKKHATSILPKSEDSNKLSDSSEREGTGKQWKRSSQEERAGIDLLQADLKGCLGRLRRAENLRL